MTQSLFSFCSNNKKKINPVASSIIALVLAAKPISRPHTDHSYLTPLFSSLAFPEEAGPTTNTFAALFVYTDNLFQFRVSEGDHALPTPKSIKWYISDGTDSTVRSPPWCATCLGCEAWLTSVLQRVASGYADRPPQQSQHRRLPPCDRVHVKFRGTQVILVRVAYIQYIYIYHLT